MKLMINEFSYEVRFEYYTMTAFDDNYHPREIEIARCSLYPYGGAFRIAEGISEQNPNDKTPNRELGRKHSFRRMLKAGNFTKTERKLFWNAFWKYRNKTPQLMRSLAAQIIPRDYTKYL